MPKLFRVDAGFLGLKVGFSLILSVCLCPDEGYALDAPVQGVSVPKSSIPVPALAPIISAPIPKIVPQEGFSPIVERCVEGVMHLSPVVLQKASRAVFNPKDLPTPSGWPTQDTSMLQEPEVLVPAQVFGSGFFIDPEGYIVTNYHVVQAILRANGPDIPVNKGIRVTLHSGKTFLATVVGMDARTDLALLKIQGPPPFKALSWGKSQKVRSGEWVLAIGNAFGMEGTVTKGIISHANRKAFLRGVTHVHRYIQTDAPIQPSGSGSPLLNSQGEIIGVNTAIFSSNGGSVGVSLAIPSDVAKGILEELKLRGRVQRGWLGLALRSRPIPLIPAVSKALGMSAPGYGVLVEAVAPQGIAQKAGIRAGDVIVKMEGVPVLNAAELQAVILHSCPTSYRDMMWWRPSDPKGKIYTAKVRIGDLDEEQKKAEEALIPTSEVRILGMVLIPVADMTPDLRRKFSLDASIKQGMLIIGIEIGTRGERLVSFVRPGDILMQLGLQGRGLHTVSTLEDIHNILQEAHKNQRDQVMCHIQRPGKGDLYHPLSLPLPR